MDVKLESLTDDDRADLEAKRKWVREHDDEQSRHEYDSLNGKLRLLDTILRNNWVA